ncbi:unnamed protein product [Prunus armeniaca]|uniref:Secreted protein n=1 Tax=Prunus armeniaca TaxID=36596 RepID=A0A6J5UH23_PRUAR|nr:unnamed protein product [Prunus armeniaca]
MLQLTSFILGLLFVMHALGHFTTAAHAHQGKEELSMTGKPVILSGHKGASCTRQVTLRYNRVVICTSTQQCKKLFEECE